MVASYDPLLILLSLAISMLGSYVGLRLAGRMAGTRGMLRKALLSAAATTLGAAIWSTHFVGMLALSLPVAVGYDVLLTLVSALVSILVTGVGLFLAAYGQKGGWLLGLGGLLMGLGICAMHYIGMAAVRANCIVVYSPFLVIVSIGVGVAAATLALRLAYRPQGTWSTMAGAAAMGLAISGLHYTAMSAASFLPGDVALSAEAPVLSPHLLAVVVALAAFLLFAFALLIALPDQPATDALAPDSEVVAAETDSAAPSPTAFAEPVAGDCPIPQLKAQFARLPVEHNKTTLLLDLDQIVSIQAEAHYTRVFDGRETHFCSFALSELEARLDPRTFLRVHRSHIINLRHAKAVEKRKTNSVVRLYDRSGPSVPVSRRNLPRLRNALGLEA